MLARMQSGRCYQDRGAAGAGRIARLRVLWAMHGKCVGGEEMMGKVARVRLQVLRKASAFAPVMTQQRPPTSTCVDVELPGFPGNAGSITIFPIWRACSTTSNMGTCSCCFAFPLRMRR